MNNIKQTHGYIVLELAQEFWMYGEEDITGKLYAFKTEKEAFDYAENNPGCIYLGVPVNYNIKEK
jgi:hypothetical protein